MRYNKIIHHSVPIKDPILLCTDFNANILGILRGLLRGKNFAGVYIHDVLSIVKDSASDVLIVNDGSDTSATVEVDIVVEVEEFRPGEVIVDMKIGAIISGVKEVFGKSLGRFDPASTIILISQSEIHSTGCVNAAGLLSLLQAGNIIPVRCIFPTNEILSDRPAIGARVYALPGKKVPPLIVKYTANSGGKNSSLIEEKLSITIKEIKRFSDILNKIKEDEDKKFALKVFDGLIDGIGLEGDIKNKSLLLDKDLNLKLPTKSGYYCRDYRTKFLESEVFYIGESLNNEAERENNFVIPAGGAEVIELLLFEYLQCIKVYCGLLSNYNSEEEVKKHSPLLNFYLSLMN